MKRNHNYNGNGVNGNGHAGVTQYADTGGSTLPELGESLTELLAQVKDSHGWDGMAYLVESALLRLGIEDWAGKAPGSISRLKRIRQAVVSKPPPPA